MTSSGVAALEPAGAKQVLNCHSSLLDVYFGMNAYKCYRKEECSSLKYTFACERSWVRSSAGAKVCLVGFFLLS